MASIDKLVPFILKWEGGDKFTNDSTDKGGATKYGITEATWRRLGHDKDKDGDIDADDVRLLDMDDFKIIFKVGYWDQWRANEIKSQSVANFLVDWTYNSGVWGIKIPQKILGLKEDGLVGKLTIEAVNARDPQAFHSQLVLARMSFIDTIIQKDIERVETKLGKKLNEKEILKLTNKRFEKGWRARILSLTFDK